jgi:hypothetical protein
MEVTSTPLYTEAMRIIRNGDTGSNLGWKVIIHLVDKGTTYTPMQVNAVNIRADYVKGYADEVTITVMIPLGKYARRIYPSRNNLEISLIKMPLAETTTDSRRNAPMESERYSAYLVDGDKSPTVGQGRETVSEEALDLIDILLVSFQLTNKAVEKMRMVTVGGTFRNTTVKDTILSILTKESQSIKVDNKRVLEGVDIIQPKNASKRDHILIPQGIKLYDLCDYVQNNIGVYNAGIGSYISGKTWHVYPLFDTSRFNESKLTMNVLILPKNKMPQLERTYRKTGNSLTILITADTSFKDDAGSNYLNEGNGVRFADANKFMSGLVETTENTTLMSRAKNINEFKIEDRPDKVNHIVVSQSKITANPYKEYSSILNRKGGYFKAIWENSDPNLLVPGMVVRLSYFDDSDIKEIFGVLLGAEHSSMKMSDYGSSRHVVNSLLHFFVNLKSE